MQKQSGMMCASLIALLVLALAGPAAAATRTWQGSDTYWTNTANWSGGAVPADTDDVIIPNLANDPTMPATNYPVTGAFASFSVSNGAVVTCLGDTGVVNEASGGTTNNPHGIGVTINCQNAVISGTLSAYAKGFPVGYGPGYLDSGAGSYGGKGYTGGSTYGSITNPTALGSGGGWDGNPGAGGGAIKLRASDTLTVNGTITANGVSHYCSGSGGSIWLICNTLAGNGTIAADGGYLAADREGGGGGRVSLQYTNSTFTGTVSVAGSPGAPPYNGQPGTLWEPQRFEGLAGSAASPVDVTITNGYQYYFANTTPTNYWNLTVVGQWIEFHAGSLVINDLKLTNDAIFRLDADLGGKVSDMNSLSITGSARLNGSSLLYLIAGTYNLSGDLSIGSNSVVYAYGDTNNINAASGGTTNNPHGIGLTIRVGGNAVIDGTINGASYGFPAGKGPGYGGSGPGGTHGGKGGDSTVAPYGSLTQPTALGSGGFQNPGGGAVKLDVADTLTLNGTITVKGGNGYFTGAGGSIWLIADTFAGGGTINAEGGTVSLPDPTRRAGGGGRLAIEYSMKTYTGTLSVASIFYTNIFNGQTGAWFQCQSPFRGTYSTGYQGVSLASVFSVTNNNTGIKIARTVSRWSKNYAQWTELSTDVAGAQLDNVATNSFSGLLPNERYRIFDNGALTNVLTSDGSGGLSFAIALTNGAHSIRVEGPAGAIFTFR